MNEQWVRRGGAVVNTNNASFLEFVTARAKKKELLEQVSDLQSVVEKQQNLIRLQDERMARLEKILGVKI